MISLQSTKLRIWSMRSRLSHQGQLKRNLVKYFYLNLIFRWDIKWVDDTHALGVFSSSEVAAEALSVRHPTILTRPLNMATPQSKSKARSVLEELLPYKPRPVSCTATARRLLQGALGQIHVHIIGDERS